MDPLGAAGLRPRVVRASEGSRGSSARWSSRSSRRSRSARRSTCRPRSPGSARSGRGAGARAGSTATLVAWAHTDWVITDTRRGMPGRVPAEIQAAFRATPGGFEPGARPAAARARRRRRPRAPGPRRRTSTRWATSTTPRTSTTWRRRCSPPAATAAAIRRPCGAAAPPRVPRARPRPARSSRAACRGPRPATGVGLGFAWRLGDDLGPRPSPTRASPSGPTRGPSYSGPCRSAHGAPGNRDTRRRAPLGPSPHRPSAPRSVALRQRVRPTRARTGTRGPRRHLEATTAALVTRPADRPRRRPRGRGRLRRARRQAPEPAPRRARRAPHRGAGRGRARRDRRRAHPRRAAARRVPGPRRPRRRHLAPRDHRPADRHRQPPGDPRPRRRRSSPGRCATAIRSSVILVDLDHFKRLNDSHGHAAGDRVLRHVGTLLAASVRAIDTAGRYGGEEFLDRAARDRRRRRGVGRREAPPDGRPGARCGSTAARS